VSTIVIEIYDALRDAGVSDDKARAAAAAVVSAEAKTDLATKVDIAEIKTLLANAESRLIKWNVGTILVVTGLVIGVLKVFQ
jgi:hypothetical protein